ncbi:MAG: PorT family protein [Muribaculaceae bacterium]|nr:PorT family protein [Muribaculaceae bacterium]
MKKTLLIAVVSLLSMSAMAQDGFTYGAKVGFDLTNFVGKDVPHDMKAGYQAGVFAEYRFTDSKFAIAPEVVFASQGGKYEDEILGVKTDVTDEFNYINVPVMLKCYVAPDFSIDLGPQVGFNVYGKRTSEAKAGGASAKTKVDVKDNLKTVDFGVGLGATYNLSENAFLQARYTLGLTKVWDVEHTNAKNGNIQVAFGYRF